MIQFKKPNPNACNLRETKPSLTDIQKRIMQGKRVSNSDLNRFARSPRGAMMLHSMGAIRG